MTHLRGRVRYSGHRTHGKRVWLIEVVNTTTGKVVHSDNTCGLSACCEAALENVVVCRAAWIMGIKASDLKSNPRAS